MLEFGQQSLSFVQAEQFDVMITENTDVCGTGQLFFTDPSEIFRIIALTELIKAKSFILTSSSMIFGSQHEEFGVPTALSYNPGLFMILHYFEQ